MSNNYNMSDTGISVEVDVFGDCSISSSDFTENFEAYEKDVYFYTEWGQYEPKNVKEIIYKQTLKRDLVEFFLEDEDTLYSWTKTEIRAMSKDTLIDLANEVLDEMGLEEADVFAGSHGWTIELDNYEWVTTRGYSQGDYAQVLVLTELMDENISGTIDNLFWDTPITAKVDLNGEEFFLELKDCYHYDRDEAIKAVEEMFTPEQGAVIVGLLPDVAEYIG